MAFRGRGGAPSISTNGGRERGPYRGRHWHYGWFYYYIPLDNTYVIMQMLMTFLILILGVIAFITTYKSTIIDPIEDIKKFFINMHLIVIGVLLVMNLIVNFCSKSENSLIKRLFIIIVISITTMLIFFGVKSNLDSTYTKSMFRSIYAEQNIENNSKKKNKISIGLSGAHIKTDEEFYIDECVKLYNIFKTKANTTLSIHFLLNFLIIFQIFKISKIQNKKQQINKDDLILFDEEQNVRF